MPGCACSHTECSPEKCGHVSLFDSVYNNLVDIHGTPMHGRFAYDEDSKIILQVIIVSITHLLVLDFLLPYENTSTKQLALIFSFSLSLLYTNRMIDIDLRETDAKTYLLRLRLGA